MTPALLLVTDERGAFGAAWSSAARPGVAPIAPIAPVAPVAPSPG